MLADRARAEADERDAAAAPTRPAARRTDRHQGGERRRGLRDHVRRQREQHAGWCRLRRWSAGCGPPVRSSSARPRCRSSVPGPTPSRSAWARPATRGTRRTRPGGSSGGTAVAVASGMVPTGIGGDGGGSIRIPSSFCGLFGLKPQRGRVSTAPNPHLWWSLGTLGPLTRTVLDSALVYDVIRGNEDTDLYRARRHGQLRRGRVGREPGRLRIGWTVKGTSPGVRPAPAARRGGRGHRPAADRARPRRPRARRSAPRPDGSVRAAVLRRHPHRGRRRRALRAARAVDPPGLPARLLGAARRRRLGVAADRQGQREGQPGLRHATTCCSPP